MQTNSQALLGQDIKSNPHHTSKTPAHTDNIYAKFLFLLIFIFIFFPFFSHRHAHSGDRFDRRFHCNARSANEFPRICRTASIA